MSSYSNQANNVRVIDEVLSLLVIAPVDDVLTTVAAELDPELFDICAVESFHEAEEVLREREFKVCVAHYRIADDSVTEFLEILHLMQYEGAFIIVTDVVYEMKAEQLPTGVTEFIETRSLNPAILEKSIIYGARNQEQSKALEKFHEVMAGNMKALASSVRNPLNIIMGYGNRLNKRLSGKVEERDIAAISEILKSANELEELIIDLVDITQIETGHVHLKKQRVNVCDAIDQSILENQAEATSKGIKIVRVVTNKNLNVMADRHRLHQILNYLLSNAVKYTEAGRIIVHAHHSDFNGLPRVLIAVKDTGVGIHANDLPYLFDRYAEVFTSASHHKSHSGLGLPIAQKLVALHGGHINVDSMPNEGSEFRVWLPAIE